MTCKQYCSSLKLRFRDGLTATYRRHNQSLGRGNSRLSSLCRVFCQIYSSVAAGKFQAKKRFCSYSWIVDEIRVHFRYSPETESNKQSWEENVPESNHVIPIPRIELLWHLQYHGKARPIITATSNLNFARFHFGYAQLTTWKCSVSSHLWFETHCDHDAFLEYKGGYEDPEYVVEKSRDKERRRNLKIMI